MSSSDKSFHQEIDRYRLISTQVVEDIDRDIVAHSEDIGRLAAIAFKDPEFIVTTAAGIAEGRISEYEASRIAAWVGQDPTAAGPLNIGLFSGQNRETVDAAVKDVVAALNRQADLCRVRQNYQELHQKALNALRLPESYQREAVSQVRLELDFCETARDSRLRGSPSEDGTTPQTAATWWEARAATGRNPLGGTDRAWWSARPERETEEPSTEPDRWTRPR